MNNDLRNSPNYCNGYYHNNPTMQGRVNIGGNNVYNAHFINLPVPNPLYNPRMPPGTTYIGPAFNTDYDIRGRPKHGLGFD